jgi:hypothetical protein
LFAASGVNLGTDIKAITFRTLFDRLRLIIKAFDEKTKAFCDEISERRNAELHSGEAPFKEMKLSAWEGRYWHAAQLVLQRMDSSLEEWLGASRAEAPKQIVEHARRATIDAAGVRVERAKESFEKRPRKDRDAALKEATSKDISFYPQLRTLFGGRWRVTCPACSGAAIMGGTQFHEEIVEEYLEDGEELVEKTYISERFFCPVCELRLDGQDEIGAADLEVEHTETETRERRYEEEYNNE